MKIENIKRIIFRKTDPRELDEVLAKVNSYNLIKGTVKFWQAIDKKTGEIEYCYSALSRI